MIALFPLLVGAPALADCGPAMLLARPLAVCGGRISYAVCLVHMPLLEAYWTAMQHVAALGPHTLLSHLAGVAVLATAIGVAAGAYRFVEEPARRRLPALGQRRALRHAAVGRHVVTDRVLTSRSRPAPRAPLFAGHTFRPAPDPPVGTWSRR